MIGTLLKVITDGGHRVMHEVVKLQPAALYFVVLDGMSSYRELCNEAQRARGD